MNFDTSAVNVQHYFVCNERKATSRLFSESLSILY